MAARYVRVGNFPDFRDELRGTIAEILATPTANDNVYGCPDDVAGASLEAKGGKWYGSLGVLTAAQWAEITTTNIGAGSTAKVLDSRGNVTSYEAVSASGSVVWVASAGLGSGLAGWDEWAFVGDSITAANNGFAPPGHGTAPGAQQGLGIYGASISLPSMASMLAFGRLRFARNFGFSGLGCQTLVEQLPLITGGRWKNFIIQIGTNDFVNKFSIGIAYYEQFIASLCASAKNIIAIAIPAKTEGNVGPWNRAQEAVCNKYGVTYINPWESISNPMTGAPASGMAPDGTHPTHYATTQLAAPILAAMLPSITPPLSPLAHPLEPSIITNGLLTSAGTSGCPAGWRQDQSFDSVSIAAPSDKRIAGRVVTWTVADVNETKLFGTGDFTVTPGVEYEISFYMKLTISSNLGFKVNFQDGGDSGTTKAVLNLDDTTQAAYQSDTYTIEGIYRTRYVPTNNLLGIRFWCGASSYATTQPYTVTVGQIQCRRLN